MLLRELYLSTSQPTQAAYLSYSAGRGMNSVAGIK
jgi:hypothetical protein